MKIKILSLSANTDSVSRAVLPVMLELLNTAGHDHSVTDIRDLPPVWINGEGLSGLPSPYQDLHDQVAVADAVLFMLPVYCYTMSSGAKAIAEVLFTALKHKPVAFVVAAGTYRSHLAIGDLMASLAFERETFCFPRHVLLTEDDLDQDRRPQAAIHRRLGLLVADFCRFADLLKTFRSQP